MFNTLTMINFITITPMTYADVWVNYTMALAMGLNPDIHPVGDNQWYMTFGACK